MLSIRTFPCVFNSLHVQLSFIIFFFYYPWKLLDFFPNNSTLYNNFAQCVGINCMLAIQLWQPLANC